MITLNSQNKHMHYNGISTPIGDVHCRTLLLLMCAHYNYAQLAPAPCYQSNSIIRNLLITARTVTKLISVFNIVDLNTQELVSNTILDCPASKLLYHWLYILYQACNSYSSLYLVMAVTLDHTLFFPTTMNNK